MSTLALRCLMIVHTRTYHTRALYVDTNAIFQVADGSVMQYNSVTNASDFGGGGAIYFGPFTLSGIEGKFGS